MVDRKKNAKKVPKAESVSQKRGRGRPATGRIRPETIGVRINEQEREIIETAAQADGDTPGNWLRIQGLKAAGHEPEE